jgi:predicted dehydrogenase
VRLGFVGCGNIAGRYAATARAYPRLELAGSFDAAPGRAEAFAEKWGGAAYGSLDELLADDDVETVVNLTFPAAHAAVTRAALEAGKHVHTEKPLALNAAEAHELAALARSRGVRLSAAPGTFLGEAQQTAEALLREGKLGRVRVAYVEVNWGRIETWHPEPETLYEVGALVDVGVYPITMLTSWFGPVRRVRAVTAELEPDRVRLDGRPFRLEAPDFAVALLELADGPLVRLTASFYVERHGRPQGIELHGDDASLHLHSFHDFDVPVELAPRGKPYAKVPLLGTPFRGGVDWARPLAALDEALAEGRPHPTSAERAAHVVEVLEAAQESAATGAAVELEPATAAAATAAGP